MADGVDIVEHAPGRVVLQLPSLPDSMAELGLEVEWNFLPPGFMAANQDSDGDLVRQLVGNPAAFAPSGGCTFRSAVTLSLSAISGRLDREVPERVASAWKKRGIRVRERAPAGGAG